MGNKKFFIWENSYEEEFCVIKPPVGINKSYQLNRGIARAEEWPSDVVCKMNPEFPKDIQLADNLYGAGLIIISKRINELLIKENVNNVEFLPISILNHKGRVTSKDYFILNPIDVVDCIDLDASNIEWNEIKKDLIDSCERLVLKEDSIPFECKVFRPKFLTLIILIRSELAVKLSEEGFTGLYFKDPLKYTGI